MSFFFSTQIIHILSKMFIINTNMIILYTFLDNMSNNFGFGVGTERRGRREKNRIRASARGWRCVSGEDGDERECHEHAGAHDSSEGRKERECPSPWRGNEVDAGGQDSDEGSDEGSDDDDVEESCTCCGLRRRARCVEGVYSGGRDAVGGSAERRDATEQRSHGEPRLAAPTLVATGADCVTHGNFLVQT